VVTDERLDLLAWLCPQPPVQRLQRGADVIRGPDVDAHAPVRDDGVDDLARHSSTTCSSRSHQCSCHRPRCDSDEERRRRTGALQDRRGDLRHCRGSRRRT